MNSRASSAPPPQLPELPQNLSLATQGEDICLSKSSRICARWTEADELRFSVMPNLYAGEEPQVLYRAQPPPCSAGYDPLVTPHHQRPCTKKSGLSIYKQSKRSTTLLFSSISLRGPTTVATKKKITRGAELDPAQAQQDIPFHGDLTPLHMEPSDTLSNKTDPDVGSVIRIGTRCAEFNRKPAERPGAALGVSAVRARLDTEPLPPQHAQGKLQPPVTWVGDLLLASSCATWQETIFPDCNYVDYSAAVSASIVHATLHHGAWALGSVNAAVSYLFGVFPHVIWPDWYWGSPS